MFLVSNIEVLCITVLVRCRATEIKHSEERENPRPRVRTAK